MVKTQLRFMALTCSVTENVQFVRRNRTDGHVNGLVLVGMKCSGLLQY